MSQAAPGPYRRVLCATDGSAASLRAAEQAVAIARLCGAELLALSAAEVDYHSGIHLRDDVRAEEQSCQQAVDGVLALAREQAVPARGLLVRGDPAAAILEAARAEGADLIVLARHSSGFLERILLGDVAARVARDSPIAVLLVPGG